MDRYIVREVREARLKTLASRLRPWCGEAFATHMPVLLALAHLCRPRRILELGSGLFSTPALLDKAFFPSVTLVHSIETDPQWADRIGRALPDRPDLRLEQVDVVATWVSRQDLSAYDLIFVDDSSSYEDRARTVGAVCDRVGRDGPVVVVHDFEVRAYRNAVGADWNAVTFDAWRPETGVLWRDGLDRSRLEAFNRRMRANRTASPTDLAFWRGLVDAG